MSSDTSIQNVKLTPLGNLATGVVTSCLNISLFHPLYTIKTHLMSGEKLALKYMYRGFSTNLLCDVSYQGALFLSYGLIEKEVRLLTKKELSHAQTSICGFLAGVTVAPVISYLERVMIIQQIAHDTLKTDKISLRKVANQIHRVEGFHGITRGLLPTVLRESLHSTCFFGLSRLFKSTILNQNDDSRLTHASYLMAGAIAGLITTPFDLIKTRMQNHISETHMSFQKTVRMLTCDLKKPKNLFQGSLARVSTVSATMLGMGIFSEKIKTFVPKSCHEI